MRVKLGGISLRIGFAAVAVMACMINSGSLFLFCNGFVAVLVHELTHLLLMVSFGCPIAEITVLPGGVRINAPVFDSLPAGRASVCLLSAPLINLALGGLMLFCRTKGEPVPYPAVLHLTLGVINLLPLSFLDGGRALERLLLTRLAEQSSRKIGSWLDLICLSLLILTGVVLSLRRIYSVPFYTFTLYCIAAFAVSRKNHVAFCLRS